MSRIGAQKCADDVGPAAFSTSSGRDAMRWTGREFRALAWENTSTPSRKAISVGIDLIPPASSGVDLAEDECPVTARRSLEARAEHPAGPAPGSPEVDEDDPVPAHRAVGGVVGQTLWLS